MIAGVVRMGRADCSGNGVANESGILPKVGDMAALGSLGFVSRWMRQVDAKPTVVSLQGNGLEWTHVACLVAGE